MSRLPVPLETKERQRRASQPATSAWVSANAGSGKTWVLSRRVIRLLLKGVPANQILCLTYTKAAAATMSNRVFSELGRWAVMPDADLAAEIADIEGETTRRPPLAKARRLFAEAIETPGGLKIQTIHGFCEALLHQFPLEADLPGRFEILEEAGERDLLARAKTRVLLAASSAADSDRLSAAFRRVIDRHGEFGLDALIGDLIGRRNDLAAWIADAGTVEAALAQLRPALRLRPTDTVAQTEAEILASPGFDAAYCADLVTALSGSGGKTDGVQAERIALARAGRTKAERLSAWLDFLFKKDGERRAANRLVTQAVARQFPDLADRFEAEATRVEALRDRLKALATLAETEAVLVLGDAVIGEYEREKRGRGALDFADLIRSAVHLLDRSPSAAWVQFKLDKGISHILVDEAQDTSPDMWRIVERLSEEFFAGEGQRLIDRTVFAVGDEKQSIYSFQGAAPDQFAAMRRRFAARAGNAGLSFDDIKLYLSFRSTPDVLGAVDAVFAAGKQAGIVADPADYAEHQALRSRSPGHVEIWPMLKPEAVAEPEDWTAPLDTPTATSPQLRLANRIAGEIEALISGPPLPGTGDRVRPRDILILVRKRDGFVAAVNRVLKERGVAVAGADRLTLTDHIAVEDLMALGRVMLIAEDDLSLAAVLKSPLIGWDDAQLFAVAYPRDEGRLPLWTALSRKAETDPAARLAYEQLSGWRARADLVPPYEFYARILGADGARRRFIARLGPEADDVLDEFLAHALEQERAGAAGLAGFLAGIEAASPVIKREMDEARDEVRVMTVHGSKGLEAAIVFLVDSGSAPVSPSHDPKFVALPIAGAHPDHAPALVFVDRSADRSSVVEARLAEVRARGHEEYRRLLYVAMTRAADRLYVAGYSGKSGPNADCWHRVVETSLQATGRLQPVAAADGEVTAFTWRVSDLLPLEPRAAAEMAVPSVDWPDWIDRGPDIETGPLRLTPSTALSSEPDASPPPTPPGLALALSRRPDSPELLRGTLIHKLLECLPALDPAKRSDAAHVYVQRNGDALDAPQRQALVAESLAVLEDPRFAAVFAAGSRAEVPIVGRLRRANGDDVVVSGQIDRLAVTATDVLILDYKTNRAPPETADGTPEAYVAQLALYRRLLAELYPDRTIRAAILWTARPALVEIAAALLDAGERRLGLI
ncbi:MAG: double-strand break repair helicase AddA [Ancalomicrobiaceae bacterium]|nr:double-strand break repair helicase AddA [Ancalomicrobiaceae bacterium]